MLDFVLASTTVNRWIVRRVDSQFDYRWTWRNARAWAKYSLPSSFLAVGMALLMPRLSSLTGLLNSVAGATLQITALPLCLWCTSNSAVAGLKQREGGRSEWRFVGVGLYGILFTVAVFVARRSTILPRPSTSRRRTILSGATSWVERCL